MGLGSAAHFSDEAAGVDGHVNAVLLEIIMSDEKESTPRTGMSKDEVALELLRFIAGTTGYGKTASGAGFGGKAAKTPEEQVDALLQLYDRCRSAVSK